MKAILLSVQPKWVKKILNGEKTIEIRKTIPKCELPIDVYIYETLGTIKKYCDENSWGINNPEYFLNYYTEDNKVVVSEGMGQVVAKFTLNIVDKIICSQGTYVFYEYPCEFYEKSQLSDRYISQYGKGKDLYAWHIDNLQIFDKPKELVEFYYKVNGNYYDGQIWTDNHVLIKVKTLTKAPQSWQYVEVVE